MNTFQLETLLLDDARSARYFRGVFAADAFAEVYEKTVKRFPTSLFVVNTDVSSQPGTHWVCVWNEGERTWFFDPFGAPAELYPTIYPSLSEREPISSAFQLQAVDTDVCGDYCYLYGVAVTRGVSPPDFALYWIGMGEQRDAVVRTLVGHLISDEHS
jgi:hypothetical protein